MSQNTIFKYTLQRGGTLLNIPAGAKILTVQMQHGAPQLWVLVDQTQTPEPRTFMVYGTGHRMPSDPGQYIGTFQMDGGEFVFHVFELVKAVMP